MPVGCTVRTVSKKARLDRVHCHTHCSPLLSSLLLFHHHNLWDGFQAEAGGYRYMPRSWQALHSRAEQDSRVEEGGREQGGRETITMNGR